MVFRLRSVLTLLVSLCLVSHLVLAEESGESERVLCRVVPPLANITTAEDRTAEEQFCGIDFTSSSVALCPKTWSTSPAALVYDLSGTEWQGKATEFEKEVCAIGGHARDQAHSELAIFKNSLNGRETSGTFAPSSLLYYHFSRLLETRLQVPVAVLAEFPAEAYHHRVVNPGLADSQGNRTKMLHAGWLEMDKALAAPAAYPNRRELFTANHERVWGVFLLQEGRRYGAEVNGTRASGWGDGQNLDFQKTAPFLALRQNLPLEQAVAFGVTQSRKDPKVAAELPAEISPIQVAWWMHEITEIVILDSILKQQDRIGNIDYLWRWVWLQDEELQIAAKKPEVATAIKLRVTVLNDNDAGVRSGYANYAWRTDMLRDWQHIDYGLYKRVQALGDDFRESGPVAEAVRGNYRLSKKEVEGIIKRGITVASILRERCDAGELRFDLGLSNILALGSGANPADSRESSKLERQTNIACG
ncbi:MAG: hypothetical protein ABJ084_03205 [Halioglobus sp.]